MTHSYYLPRETQHTRLAAGRYRNSNQRVSKNIADKVIIPVAEMPRFPQSHSIKRKVVQSQNETV